MNMNVAYESWEDGNPTPFRSNSERLIRVSPARLPLSDSSSGMRVDNESDELLDRLYVSFDCVKRDDMDVGSRLGPL